VSSYYYYYYYYYSLDSTPLWLAWLDAAVRCCDAFLNAFHRYHLSIAFFPWLGFTGCCRRACPCLSVPISPGYFSWELVSPVASLERRLPEVVKVGSVIGSVVLVKDCIGSQRFVVGCSSEFG
jgi:hypothetical protein